MKLKYSHLTFRNAWPGKTYRARAGSFSYLVGHDGTRWRLQVWKDGVATFIDGYLPDGKASASALMAVANEHASRE